MPSELNQPLLSNTDESSSSNQAIVPRIIQRKSRQGARASTQVLPQDVWKLVLDFVSRNYRFWAVDSASKEMVEDYARKYQKGGVQNHSYNGAEVGSCL